MNNNKEKGNEEQYVVKHLCVMCEAKCCSQRNIIGVLAATYVLSLHVSFRQKSMKKKQRNLSHANVIMCGVKKRSGWLLR